MSDYLFDDIFKIRGVVVEGFEMSDVDNVLVLCDKVTDCVNIFYIINYFNLKLIN